MAITFSCPSCGKTIKTGDDSSGKTGRCPHCQNTFQIPGQAAQNPDDPLGDSASSPHDPMSSDLGNTAGAASSNPYAASNAPIKSTQGFGREHRGPTVLVLGILSLVTSIVGMATLCCCPLAPLSIIGIAFGVIALLMGQSDLKAMRNGEMSPDGEGQTRAGWIMGICGVALGALLLIGNVFMLAAMFLGNIADM